MSRFGSEPYKQTRYTAPPGDDGADLGRLLFDKVKEGRVHAPIRRLPRNVNLYSWGDTGDWLYLIQRGWVKSVTWSWRGKPCLLGLHGSADILGVSGLVTGHRGETAMTKTDAEIRVIARDQFQQIMAEGVLREAWHHFLTTRITEQQELLTHFVTLDSQQRLAATLLRLARRYGVAAECSLRIDCRVTHEELAQMVGTTRSRVGFFLKDFEGQELIEQRPRSLVVNEDRLLDYLLAAS